jgi:hypothetical protein
VLDTQRKQFCYIKPDDLFLCGFSVEDALRLGYDFYSKIIYPEDLSLWADMDKVIWRYLKNDEEKRDNIDYFSCIFRLQRKFSFMSRALSQMVYCEPKQYLQIKKIIRYYLPVIFFCLTIGYVQAQAVQERIAAFDEYTANHPVEKLYLHLNKTYYTAGEYMFFRAYLTDRDLRQDKAGSHIIYVELIDGEKHVLERVLLYSIQNEYAGQILIPDTLAAGNYYIRAYTNLMRNRGEEYFFAKDITIGNDMLHAVNPAEKEETWDFECGFYPEGGRLVSGVMSRVAFKAVSSDGFGTEVEGELQDINGRKITTLHSAHKGMGRFWFIPEMGKPYYALLKSKGREKRFRLPMAEQGASLTYYEQRDTLHLIVQRPGNNHREVYHITGQTRDKTCYSAFFRLEEGGQRILIPAASLPKGIIRFTLYDEKAIPQCERLAFNSYPDSLHIDIRPDKPAYAAREPILLEIQVTDDTGNPVTGSFSLAVMDVPGAIRQAEAFNIRAYLLLSADLKGYIEEPGWYFNDVNREKKEALDILLCTQGWTSYKSPGEYPVETDFTVSGKVVNVYGRAVAQVEVNMWDISGRNFPGESITNKEGDFGFIGFDTPENASFLLKTNMKKREYLRIFTDKKDNKGEINRLPIYPYKYTFPGDSLIVTMGETSHVLKDATEGWNVELGEVSVISRRRYREEIKSAGKTGNTLEGSLLQQFNFDGGIEEAMNLLPPPNSRPPESQSGHYGALFLLQSPGPHSAMEVTPHQFYSYPAYMIDRIEVFPYKIVEGTDETVHQGVVVAHLKTSPEKPEEESLRPGLEIYRPEGYCITKEFFVPPYDTKTAYNDTIPDRRTSLYWQPVLNTDHTGRGSVSFYAADKLTDYTVIVEGISADGIPDYGMKTIKVTQPKKDKEFTEEIQSVILSNDKSSERVKINSMNVLEFEDIQKLRCQDIYCLLQHLSQVRVNGKRVSVGGGPVSIHGGSSPLIIINGIEGSLEQVNIHNVRRIEFSSTGSMYGARGANGVIDIKTK